MTEARALKHGYYLTRGNYTGTTDNRLDRWYWQRTDTDYLDYRGRGFTTKKEALEHLEIALEEEL